MLIIEIIVDKSKCNNCYYSGRPMTEYPCVKCQAIKTTRQTIDTTTKIIEDKGEKQWKKQ